MLAARRRTSRLIVTGVSVLLMLLLSTQSVAAATWTAPVKSGPSYSYNYGKGLARTVSSTTSYLHEQYVYVNTTNPGVYYRRGNSSGSTWGTQKRMNPSGGFAENGAIAASSNYVYVAYQTIESWDNFDPAAARSIGVRVNTNHGSSTAWLAAKTLSVETRVGRPALAASGAYGYLVYTDAETGNIVFATNNGVNNDSGWTAQALGTTTHQTSNGAGYEGDPVVAATGASVMVAWVSGDGATITARISADRGVTWGDVTNLTGAAVWDLAASAASGRFGIAWAQSTGIKVKLYRNGAWASTKTVASFSSTGTWRAGYGVAIGLAGTARVGVAWSACSRTDCSASSTGTKGVSTRWRESSDNIATWKTAETIASYGVSTSRRYSDWPSVVFTSTPRRYVVYNIANSTVSTFTLLFELGK